MYTVWSNNLTVWSKFLTVWLKSLRCELIIYGVIKDLKVWSKIWRCDQNLGGVIKTLLVWSNVHLLEIVWSHRVVWSFHMFFSDVLERNEPGKWRKRQWQNNAVNKGDRSYTPRNTTVLRAHTQMCLYSPQRSARKPPPCFARRRRDPHGPQSDASVERLRSAVLIRAWAERRASNRKRTPELRNKECIQLHYKQNCTQSSCWDHVLERLHRIWYRVWICRTLSPQFENSGAV